MSEISEVEAEIREHEKQIAILRQKRKVEIEQEKLEDIKSGKAIKSFSFFK